MRSANAENGYTLIELLVVILIIGLIAAIATPLATTSIRAANARSDVYTLTTNLRDLQREAVEKQQTISVASASGKLVISSGNSIALSEEAVLIFKEPITYFSDGTTTGGLITLRNSNSATTIEVSWLTGALSLRTE